MTLPAPRRRGPNRRRWAAVLVSVALGLGSGAAQAAFTATTAVSGNTVSVAAAAGDTTAPAVARTTVARTAGVPAASIAAGRYRQNAGYRVYAQVTDAVGVTSVTADPTAIGGGTTTTAMTLGSYTVAGQTYNYATTTLTAADVAATGVTKTYTVAAADAAANVTTTPDQDAVAETYAQAIAATATVVGHWPLGSTTGAAATTIDSDAFTDIDGRDLAAHVGDSTWTERAADRGTIVSNGGKFRVRQNNTGTVVATGSGVPPTADYRVEADVVVLSKIGGSAAGVVGRRAATGRHYRALYDITAGTWKLDYCTDGGSCSTLASAAGTVTAGQTYRLVLELRGTALQLLVNGVLVTTATHSLNTAAGLGGIHFAATAAPATATGMHLDNYAVKTLDARTTPSVTGTAPAGAITGDALLNQPGALTDDTGTAIGLDGVDDSVRVVRNAGNGYLVSGNFTLETWFRAAAGYSGDNTTWYSQKRLIDATASGGATRTDFGSALRNDGRVTAGVGGNGTSYSAGTADSGASPLYNGATGWHHVVVTRTTATGVVVVYVDGSQRGTTTATQANLTSADALAFGASALATTSTSNFDTATFLLGAMDEVAIYSSPLTAAQVTDHYNAGKGTG